MKENLQKTIEAINKRHGDNAVMDMEKDSVLDIGAISTGSLGLDIALGINGFPKGRITEIAGLESSGKCLVKESFILTENGYKTIESIFKSNNLDLFCITKTIEKQYPLVNFNGDIEETTHFTYNGRRDVYEIISDSGFKHKGTPNHPLLCMSKNGN